MEGFGLTALEAAACSTPVICSDIPTMREIMGSSAEYFDPNSLTDIIEVLTRTLSDEKGLKDLGRLALERSQQFSWRQAAEQTLALYKEVLG